MTSSRKFYRRPDARPDEILDAALALFLEDGIQRTRVADIAARAGISKGAIYLYFPSKDALVLALVRRRVTPVVQRIVDLLDTATGDPRPTLGAVLQIIIDGFLGEENQGVPKILLREAPISPEVVTIYRREMVERVMPLLTALVARGVAEGHIRPVDPVLTIQSVFGPVFLQMSLGNILGIGPPEGGLQALADNHMMILTAGLAPER
ncbi:TetR/AcrR family transcriptional regulator [Pseudoroseicyclus sp. CXY001]|uniref:TetR/AcrR family transcriptional regulator n=1 Tax=Pseudoroseicyclus sp. CXY001 TaxID=3242492 RepID=UPI003570EC0A